MTRLKISMGVFEVGAYSFRFLSVGMDEKRSLQIKGKNKRLIGRSHYEQRCPHKLCVCVVCLCVCACVCLCVCVCVACVCLCVCLCVCMCVCVCGVFMCLCLCVCVVCV